MSLKLVPSRQFLVSQKAAAIISVALSALNFGVLADQEINKSTASQSNNPTIEETVDFIRSVVNSCEVIDKGVMKKDDGPEPWQQRHLKEIAYNDGNLSLKNEVYYFNSGNTSSFRYEIPIKGLAYGAKVQTPKARDSDTEWNGNWTSSAAIVRLNCPSNICFQFHPLFGYDKSTT